VRISHKHKFIFLALPRTGSTTVRKILDDYSDIKSVHITQVTQQFPFYHHISARELKRIFDKRRWDWFAYQRFCVVRNPFDRVVSLYHHHKKINYDKNRLKTPLYRFIKYLHFRVRPELTFSEYVMNLNPKGKLTTTLKEFICDDDGEFLVDDILTFETLACVLPDYLKLMGIFITSDEIPVLNSTEERKPYASYYTDKTRKIVESIYAYELERFSYVFKAVLLTEHELGNNGTPSR
jgi:Sulfotransferase family